LHCTHLVAESSLVKAVKHVLLNLLRDVLVLAENDVALARDVLLRVLAVAQDVAEDVEALAAVLLEALRVEHCLFAAGVRVQVRTHVLDRRLELRL
jgi:hypothetical protein